LIHVDGNEENFSRSTSAELHVAGDIRAVFESVASDLKSKAQIEAPDRELLSLRLNVSMDDEDRFYDDSEPMKPQRLMGLLSELFPPQTRYLADTGNSFAWAIHYLHPGQAQTRDTPRPQGGLFRSSVEFGSMGWAIGASVGTALGSPETPVVCITGDGSMLMAGQELTTAVQENLNVVFVVLNDAAYGMVKHGQRLGGAEDIGNKLPDVNFAAMAQALGAEGHVLHSAVDLLALDSDEICARRGPTVLDVRVDPEQVPPIQSRISVLGADVA
jgi:acetolactate synthase-1/2/3 large subunit